MTGPQRDPAAGAAVGALSAIKNRKLMTAIGASMIVVGVAGMIIGGSQAYRAVQNQQFGIGQGETFQMMQYVFMFVLIGGLVLVIYSQVSAQREKAKKRESQAYRDSNPGPA